MSQGLYFVRVNFFERHEVVDNFAQLFGKLDLFVFCQGQAGQFSHMFDIFDTGQGSLHRFRCFAIANFYRRSI